MRRLGFEKTRKILKNYSIPYVESVLVGSQKQALKAAERIGFPVVLKTASSEVVHRTERGGVVRDIENKRELKKGWKRVSKLGKKAIVQPRIKGTEIAIGMKRDRQFGPVIMFGLGGVFVEVLEDVSFRVAPVSKKEAKGQIKEIKGFKLLTGFRGREGVDLEKLVDIIKGLSRLSLKEKEIKEVDFNPVIADSEKARVVDAKILPK